MTLYAGANLKLYIAEEEGSNNFQPLGGLVSKTISLRGNYIENGSLQFSSWRENLEEAGQNTLRLSGAGVFEGGEIAREILALLMGQKTRKWRVEIAGLGILEGRFAITRFDITGPYAGVEQFSIALESSGEIEYMGEME